MIWPGLKRRQNFKKRQISNLDLFLFFFFLYWWLTLSLPWQPPQEDLFQPIEEGSKRRPLNHTELENVSIVELFLASFYQQVKQVPVDIFFGCNAREMGRSAWCFLTCARNKYTLKTSLFYISGCPYIFRILEKGTFFSSI